MDAETWIETATTALRKLAREFRADAARFRTAADLLDSIADRAPPATTSEIIKYHDCGHAPPVITVRKPSTDRRLF